jgi:LacI family gluconate utilization system Gnt-I transcriptional repressor
VQEAASRLGYVYDSTAQAFRAQRSGFLALTLPSINNANFAATHTALTASLAGSGLQILLGITDYDVDEEERLVRQLLARRPEALILTGGSHTDQTRHLLNAIDIPVVELWDMPGDPIQHVVGCSNAKAMAMVVAHLAQTGRRKLAFLGASDSSDRRGHARRIGAIEAAQSLGLPEVVQINTGAAPATMTSATAALERSADLIQGLDALVCVSDPVAFGAIMAMQKMGLKVPEDIAVTGFGDFEIARIFNPNITTVHVGAAEIGSETGALVQTLLSGELSDTPVIQHLTPELRIGQST